MEILVISQYWAPENGVPQRRWSWLTELLRDQGHNVTVIAPPPHYDRQMELKTWLKEKRYRSSNSVQIGEKGERIIRSGFVPAGKSLTLRVLNQAAVATGALAVIGRCTGPLRSYKPDIIVGTVPALPTAAVTWFASQRFRRPYVVDLRDAWPDLLDEAESWNDGTGKISLRQRILSKGPLQLTSWMTKRVLYRALRDASGIIATSSELARNLEHRSEIHTHGKSPRIHTLRNVFPIATEPSTSRQGDSDRTVLNILYAGTIGRAQDLQNAVQAVNIAHKQGVPVHLRFVGSGATKKDLQKLAATGGGKVTFEPRHPADSLEDYYGWADTALVHLADWEPLTRTVPSKLYELMEAGVHVTAVVRGETARIVEEFDAGDVVAPNSPESLAQLWKELFQDRSRLHVSDAGKEWVIEERSKKAPAVLQQVLAEVALSK